VNDRALGRVNQALVFTLRPAHTALFPHIDLVHGTRLTSLANALGISKQATGQLVDELVEMGALQRRPDPDDGRAKRVCFVGRQRHGVLEGLDLLGAEERDLREALGERRFSELRRGLLALEAVLDVSLSE
jgi:DNA-binding MarR family transcriptional regulator